MAEPDFKSLNETIERAGAKWKAAQTTHSKYWGLPAGQSLFGLAFNPDKALAENLEVRRAEAQRVMAVAPPPAHIDWRANAKNFVTPIRNQGTCGSCVAFATCASLESRSMIKVATPDVDFDLSEAHLFYCGTTNACDLGWDFALAMAAAATRGIGRERDFPYTPGNQSCRSIAPVVKVASHVTSATTIERKRAVVRGPVVGGLEVFEDFYAYSSGVYRHVSGSFVGWHAVAVIGYDDKDGCWIAKNSWGTGWGEAGFFRIAYGDCGIDSKVLFYEPDVTILPATTVP